MNVRPLLLLALALTCYYSTSLSLLLARPEALTLAQALGGALHYQLYHVRRRGSR